MNAVAISKYNNRRTHTEDGWFDSQRELRRWHELKLLERAGKISELKRQVDFELIPPDLGLRAIVYRADFVYIEDGAKIVEDSKGYRDRVYKLKRRLMRWRHKVTIRET
jgi:ferredoxin-fold anticodon binding domain-containing protein